jgi:hypothetical protein
VDPLTVLAACTTDAKPFVAVDAVGATFEVAHVVVAGGVNEKGLGPDPEPNPEKPPNFGEAGGSCTDFIRKICKALTKYSPNPRVREVHSEVQRKTKLYLKPWFALANHVFWRLQNKRRPLQLLDTHCRFTRTDSSAFWKPLPGSSTSYSRQ